MIYGIIGLIAVSLAVASSVVTIATYKMTKQHDKKCDKCKLCKGEDTNA